MDYSFFLIGVSSGSLCLSHSISICNIRVHCILHLFFGATCHRVTKIHKSIIMIKNMKLSWNSNGCYHMIFSLLPDAGQQSSKSQLLRDTRLFPSLKTGGSRKHCRASERCRTHRHCRSHIPHGSPKLYILNY